MSLPGRARIGPPAGFELPKVHIIAKNRLTQYVGPVSAYSAVLRSIDTDVESLMANQREFSANTADKTIIDIRDFQTAGVVAHARGCPFYLQHPGRIDILGRCIQVNRDSVDNCVEAIEELVKGAIGEAKLLSCVPKTLSRQASDRHIAINTRVYI